MNLPWRKNEDSLVEARVNAAIESVLRGSEADVRAAFSALERLDDVAVVAEIFLSVEDVTAGVELDDLIAASRIPLPDHPRAIVEAVRAHDMSALEALTSRDDLGVSVEALLNLVVAFRDARERL